MEFLKGSCICSICLHLYMDPVRLVCMHTFCRSCIDGHRQDSNNFLCPKCKVYLKDGWNTLTDNIFVRAQVEEEEKRRAKAKVAKAEEKIEVAVKEEVTKEQTEEKVKTNTEIAAAMTAEIKMNATVAINLDTEEEEVDLEAEMDRGRGGKRQHLEPSEKEAKMIEEKELEMDEGKEGTDSEEERETEPKRDTETEELETEAQMTEDMEVKGYTSPSKSLQLSKSIPNPMKDQIKKGAGTNIEVEEEEKKEGKEEEGEEEGEEEEGRVETKVEVEAREILEETEKKEVKANPNIPSHLQCSRKQMNEDFFLKTQVEDEENKIKSKALVKINMDVMIKEEERADIIEQKNGAKDIMKGEDEVTMETEVKLNMETQKDMAVEMEDETESDMEEQKEEDKNEKQREEEEEEEEEEERMREKAELEAKQNLEETGKEEMEAKIEDGVEDDSKEEEDASTETKTKMNLETQEDMKAQIEKRTQSNIDVEEEEGKKGEEEEDTEEREEVEGRVKAKVKIKANKIIEETDKQDVKANTNIPSKLQCSICLDLYKDPVRIAVCGHAFCWKCLDVFNQNNSKDLVCPKCKAFQKGGRNRMKVDIFLRYQVEEEENKIKSKALAKADMDVMMKDEERADIIEQKNGSKDVMKGEHEVKTETEVKLNMATQEDMTVEMEDERESDMEEQKEEEENEKEREEEEDEQEEEEERMREKAELEAKQNLEETGKEEMKAKIEDGVEDDSKEEEDARTEIKTKMNLETQDDMKVQTEKGTQSNIEVEEEEWKEGEEEEDTEEKEEMEGRVKAKVKVEANEIIEKTGKQDIKANTNIPSKLQCSICLDLYKHPVRIAVCRHAFCWKCLDDFNQNNSKDLVCPKCKIVQKGGRKQMKVNIFLRHQVEEEENKIKSKSLAKADMNEEVKNEVKDGMEEVTEDEVKGDMKEEEEATTDKEINVNTEKQEEMTVELGQETECDTELLINLNQDRKEVEEEEEELGMGPKALVKAKEIMDVMLKGEVKDDIVEVIEDELRDDLKEEEEVKTEKERNVNTEILEEMRAQLEQETEVERSINKVRKEMEGEEEERIRSPNSLKLKENMGMVIKEEVKDDMIKGTGDGAKDGSKEEEEVKTDTEIKVNSGTQENMKVQIEKGTESSVAVEETDRQDRTRGQKEYKSERLLFKTKPQVKEFIKVKDYSLPSNSKKTSNNDSQHCGHRNAKDKDLECIQCKGFQNGSMKQAKRAQVEEEELKMKSMDMTKAGTGIASRPDIFPESLKLRAPHHVIRPLFGAYKTVKPLLADQDQSLGQTFSRLTGPSQEVYHRNSSGPQACARADRVNEEGEMGIPAETARDTAELLTPLCTEEVSCHVCTGKRLRAVKSCLVCLTSYCEKHIKLHNAHKHKLVEPVVNLEECMCKEHERLQELFCKEDQTTLCVLCTETIHRTHCTVPVEREWSEKKAELLKTKDCVEEKIQERMRKLTEFQTSALDCKNHIKAEEQEVHGVFEEVLKAVRSAQEEALRPLRERRRRLEEEEQRLRQELEEEMRKLEAIATDLSQLLHQEDPIQFLQKYPKEPDMKGGQDWEDVTMDTELNFPSLRNITAGLLNDIQAELDKLTALEIRRVQKFTVDVTLDQDTANPHLRVSEDGKEVSHGSSPLEVPDVPQRFDVFGSLLGQNQLSSGRAYWEVEVGDKTGWDIGVASEAANRKGQISFEPAHGYWALVLYGEGCYAALDNPKVNLSLPSKPQKVGVFVDHEAGLVSFYDLEVKGHIYSFTGCSFGSGLKLFPYFSPHFPNGQRNSAPLVISPVKKGA